MSLITWWPGNASPRPFKVATTLIAPAGVFDLPGPAAGMLRVFNYSALVYPANGTGAVAIRSVLQPANLVLNLACTASTLLGAVGPVVLGTGESIEITNNSAIGVQLTYYYYDVPQRDMVLVRQTLTSVPVTVIPAPALGRQRRWVLFETANELSSFRLQAIAALVAITDSAAVRLQFFYGAAPIALQYSVNSPTGASAGVIPSPVVVTAATGDFRAGTLVAPATTPPVLLGVYEDIRDAA